MLNIKCVNLFQDSGSFSQIFISNMRGPDAGSWGQPCFDHVKYLGVAPIKQQIEYAV